MKQRAQSNRELALAKLTRAVIGISGLSILGCGPSRVAVGGSESESTGGAETETGDTTSDETKFDLRTDDTAGTDEPEPEVQLIVALGSGLVDGESSFGPAQRFPTRQSVGLTALRNPQGMPQIATWDTHELCLATVFERDGILTLDWHECLEVGPLWDATRMDANGDDSDELLVLKLGGSFESFGLDPASPTGLADAVAITNPTPWDRSYGLTTGSLDAVPGDEAVATGSTGDLVLGATPTAVVVHGGDSLVATAVAEQAGSPHIAELTGDELPDLLIANHIYRGTNDVDLVEMHLPLATGAAGLLTMDGQGDGISEVARVLEGTDDCADPGMLELYTGPFIGSTPTPSVLDATDLDAESALLVGDLDHDGVDEIVSVGVHDGVCPGAARWTVTSVNPDIGTSAAVDLCDADCLVVARLSAELAYTYPIAAELVDVNGDGHLDLAVLVEVD